MHHHHHHIVAYHSPGGAHAVDEASGPLDGPAPVRTSTLTCHVPLGASTAPGQHAEGTQRGEAKGVAGKQLPAAKRGRQPWESAVRGPRWGKAQVGCVCVVRVRVRAQRQRRSLPQNHFGPPPAVDPQTPQHHRPPILSPAPATTSPLHPQPPFEHYSPFTMATEVCALLSAPSPAGQPRPLPLCPVTVNTG